MTIGISSSEACVVLTDKRCKMISRENMEKIGSWVHGVRLFDFEFASPNLLAASLNLLADQRLNIIVCDRLLQLLPEIMPVSKILTRIHANGQSLIVKIFFLCRAVSPVVMLT